MIGAWNLLWIIPLSAAIGLIFAGLANACRECDYEGKNMRFREYISKEDILSYIDDRIVIAGCGAETKEIRRKILEMDVRVLLEDMNEYDY